MTTQPATVQDALAEATKLVTQAFAIIGTVLEKTASTEDLEALTVQEAMALLRKSKTTIYEMCHDGRLVLIDGRIPKPVIREYLSGNRKPKKPPRGRR